MSIQIPIITDRELWSQQFRPKQQKILDHLGGATNPTAVQQIVNHGRQNPTKIDTDKVFHSIDFQLRSEVNTALNAVDNKIESYKDTLNVAISKNNGRIAPLEEESSRQAKHIEKLVEKIEELQEKLFTNSEQIFVILNENNELRSRVKDLELEHSKS